MFPHMNPSGSISKPVDCGSVSHAQATTGTDIIVGHHTSTVDNRGGSHERGLRIGVSGSDNDRRGDNTGNENRWRCENRRKSVNGGTVWTIPRVVAPRLGRGRSREHQTEEQGR